MKYFFCLLVYFAATDSAGQTKKFIEPNISVSYDAARFAISEPYTNSAYGTEGYDFKDTKDITAKRVIHIRTRNRFFMPDKKLLDSAYLMNRLITNTHKADSGMKLIAKRVNVIKDFMFAGIIMEHVKSKRDLLIFQE